MSMNDGDGGLTPFRVLDRNVTCKSSKEIQSVNT